MSLQNRAFNRTPWHLKLTVAVDYLLSNLGFYTVFPVLAAVLVRDGHVAWVGVSLFFFTFAMRGASLFVVRLIVGLPFRVGLVWGLLASGIAFALLAFNFHPLLTLLLLVAAGFGISVNGAVTRLYIASALSLPSARHRAFTLIQVMVNVSAAVGPLIGNLLLGSPRWQLFTVVSILYVAAAAGVMLLVPGGVRPDPQGVRQPLRLSVLREALADRETRTTMGFAVLGRFLYAQLFSGIALEVVAVMEDPLLRASIFTVNAVLVVGLQFPVTSWVARLLDRRAANTSEASQLLLMRAMRLGLLLFCLAFALLGTLVLVHTGLVHTGLVHTGLGETLYTPTVDTSFTNLDQSKNRNVMELINLRQISVAIGESAGAFAGSSIALLSTLGPLPGLPWYALALGGAVATLLLRGRRQTV